MTYYKEKVDQLRHEKTNLISTYENNALKYQSHINALESKNILLMNEVRKMENQFFSNCADDHDKFRLLLERIDILKSENSRLMSENERQRMVYEQYLNEISDQVIETIMSQQTLREDCFTLRQTVSDLKRQFNDQYFIFKQHFYWSPDVNNQEISESVTESGTNNAQHEQKEAAACNLDSTQSLQSIFSDINTDDALGRHRMSTPPPWVYEDKEIWLDDDNSVSSSLADLRVSTFSHPSHAYAEKISLTSPSMRPNPHSMTTQMETEFPIDNSSPIMKLISIVEKPCLSTEHSICGLPTQTVDMNRGWREADSMESIYHRHSLSFPKPLNDVGGKDVSLMSTVNKHKVESNKSLDSKSLLPSCGIIQDNKKTKNLNSIINSFMSTSEINKNKQSNRYSSPDITYMSDDLNSASIDVLRTNGSNAYYFNCSGDNSNSCLESNARSLSSTQSLNDILDINTDEDIIANNCFSDKESVTNEQQLDVVVDNDELFLYQEICPQKYSCLHPISSMSDREFRFSPSRKISCRQDMQLLPVSISEKCCDKNMKSENIYLHSETALNNFSKCVSVCCSSYYHKNTLTSCDGIRLSPTFSRCCTVSIEIDGNYSKSITAYTTRSLPAVVHRCQGFKALCLKSMSTDSEYDRNYKHEVDIIPHRVVSQQVISIGGNISKTFTANSAIYLNTVIDASYKMRSLIPRAVCCMSNILPSSMTNKSTSIVSVERHLAPVDDDIISGKYCRSMKLSKEGSLEPMLLNTAKTVSYSLSQVLPIVKSLPIVTVKPMLFGVSFSNSPSAHTSWSKAESETLGLIHNSNVIGKITSIRDTVRVGVVNGNSIDTGSAINMKCIDANIALTSKNHISGNIPKTNSFQLYPIDKIAMSSLSNFKFNHMYKLEDNRLVGRVCSKDDGYSTLSSEMSCTTAVIQHNHQDCDVLRLTDITTRKICSRVVSTPFIYNDVADDHYLNVHSVDISESDSAIETSINSVYAGYWNEFAFSRAMTASETASIFSRNAHTENSCLNETRKIERNSEMNAIPFDPTEHRYPQVPASDRSVNNSTFITTNSCRSFPRFSNQTATCLAANPVTVFSPVVTSTSCCDVCIFSNTNVDYTSYNTSRDLQQINKTAHTVPTYSLTTPIFALSENTRKPISKQDSEYTTQRNNTIEVKTLICDFRKYKITDPAKRNITSSQLSSHRCYGEHNDPQTYFIQNISSISTHQSHICTQPLSYVKGNSSRLCNGKIPCPHKGSMFLENIPEEYVHKKKLNSSIQRECSNAKQCEEKIQVDKDRLSSSPCYCVDSDDSLTSDIGLDYMMCQHFIGCKGMVKDLQQNPINPYYPGDDHWSENVADNNKVRNKNFINLTNNYVCSTHDFDTTRRGICVFSSEKPKNENNVALHNARCCLSNTQVIKPSTEFAPLSVRRQISSPNTNASNLRQVSSKVDSKAEGTIVYKIDSKPNCTLVNNMVSKMDRKAGNIKDRAVHKRSGGTLVYKIDSATNGTLISTMDQKKEGVMDAKTINNMVNTMVGELVGTTEGKIVSKINAQVNGKVDTAMVNKKNSTCKKSLTKNTKLPDKSEDRRRQEVNSKKKKLWYK